MANWKEFSKLFAIGTVGFSYLFKLLLAFAITAAIKVFLRLATARLRRLSQKTVTLWDDLAVDLLACFRTWVIFVWVFHFLSNHVNHPPIIQKSLLTALVVGSLFQVGTWGYRITQFWREQILEPRIKQDPSSAAALGLLFTLVRILFGVTLLLIGLSNIGINISALLAGLGVGGIAVALAAQNVLGDLLASLSIVLDKPFVVGDFIIVGNEKGTVEHIGIKTTRLRSYSGEQIILANKGLIESRIQNCKRMWERRVGHRFSVHYSTPPSQLEQIPGWIREFIAEAHQLKFDRCHLVSYGNAGLEFEFVFYVQDPDYNLFMDLQQSLLVKILKKLEQEKIRFSFPHYNGT